jgi:hypothetical protein
MLVEAADAGRFSAVFVDEDIPMAPFEKVERQEQPGRLAREAYHHARALFRDDRKADSADTGVAIMLFGKRLFQDSRRLPNRLAGLQIMQSEGLRVLNTLPDEVPGGAETVNAWKDALSEIESLWKPKITKVVQSTAPQIGDLVRIAKEDEDVAFRVAATLQLGVAKFNPQKLGNEALIEEAIEQLQEDEEPRVREAAEAAEAFTREELRDIF